MGVINGYSSVEEYENSGQASFDNNVISLHKSYVEQEQKIDPAFHELAMAASTRLNQYWSIIYPNYRAGANGNADTGGTTGGTVVGISSGDKDESPYEKARQDANRVIDAKQWNGLYTWLTKERGFGSEAAKAFLAKEYIMAHDFYPQFIRDGGLQQALEKTDDPLLVHFAKEAVRFVEGVGNTEEEIKAEEEAKAVPRNPITGLPFTTNVEFHVGGEKKNWKATVVQSDSVQYGLGFVSGLGLNLHYDHNNYYKQSDEFKRGYDLTNSIGHLLAPSIEAGISAGSPPTMGPPLRLAGPGGGGVAGIFGPPSSINTGASRQQNIKKAWDRLLASIKGSSKAVISNPLPADGIYARAMPENIAKALKEGKVKLSPNSDAWVTTVEDLKGLTSTEEVAKKLALIDKEGALRLNNNAIVEFRLKDPSGIASPINRIDPGFVGGGRTAGGAREFIIPSDAEIEIIGIRILE